MRVVLFSIIFVYIHKIAFREQCHMSVVLSGWKWWILTYIYEATARIITQVMITNHGRDTTTCTRDEC